MSTYSLVGPNNNSSGAYELATAGRKAKQAEPQYDLASAGRKVNTASTASAAAGPAKPAGAAAPLYDIAKPEAQATSKGSGAGARPTSPKDEKPYVKRGISTEDAAVEMQAW